VAIHYHAGLAGCTATIEPATHLLLLNEFTPQQCRVLFPKNPSKDFRDSSVKLYRELQAIAALPADAPDRAEREREAGVELDVLLEDKCAKSGRRMDVQIVDPRTGEEVWTDPTCIHTTGTTKLAAERKETMRRLGSENKEVKGAPSPAVKAAHKKKQETYALMLAIAEKQAANGSRVTAPLFFPAVVSTHGEFCEGMVSLQEWLTSKYRARLQREGDRDDGAPIELLTGRFRYSLRASVLLAMAKGQAGMLLAAGLPTGQRAVPRPSVPIMNMASRLEGLGLVARARADPLDGLQLLTQPSDLSPT